MMADRVTLSSSREDAKRRAFDLDVHRAWQAIGDYLSCHDATAEDASDARSDAIAAMCDAMTGDELRAGAVWAGQRAERANRRPMAERVAARAAA